MNLTPVYLFLLSTLTAQPTPLFTDAQRAQLVTYWSAPGRYSKSLPPDAVTKGVWQVRLTPDGSTWLLKYQNAIGSRGVAPTVDPTSIASDRSGWKTWVQARIASDRRIAQDAADAANQTLRPPVTDSAGTPTPNPQRPTPAPPDPGPIPPSLLAAVGNPPPFASPVAPMKYSVTFDDADAYVYTDNVLLPQAFAYYRFPQGVAVSGARAPDSETAAVFMAAGMTDSEQRIAGAVSKLEGSFEAINTYDTGFVSVGFIQFITLDDGKHSLCEVLQQEKRDQPDDFVRDFHRYGVDVTVDGVIDVVDPVTGAELSGSEAVHKLVDDKRLIAVFQRAGRHSAAFRVAQVRTAKSHYWPADDVIVINTGTQTLTGKVSDVIHSEAGIATLFDRKVNRGTCEPISAVVAKIMQAHGLSSLADAAQYEREIIAALKYRVDFLADTTLGQPE
jgi:hypothetical protein